VGIALCSHLVVRRRTDGWAHGQTEGHFRFLKKLLDRTAELKSRSKRSKRNDQTVPNKVKRSSGVAYNNTNWYIYQNMHQLSSLHTYIHE